MHLKGKTARVRKFSHVIQHSTNAESEKKVQAIKIQRVLVCQPMPRHVGLVDGAFFLALGGDGSELPHDVSQESQERSGSNGTLGDPFFSSAMTAHVLKRCGLSGGAARETTTADVFACSLHLANKLLSRLL